MDTQYKLPSFNTEELYREAVQTNPSFQFFNIDDLEKHIEIISRHFQFPELLETNIIHPLSHPYPYIYYWVYTMWKRKADDAKSEQQELLIYITKIKPHLKDLSLFEISRRLHEEQKSYEDKITIGSISRTVYPIVAYPIILANIIFEENPKWIFYSASLQKAFLNTVLPSVNCNNVIVDFQKQNSSYHRIENENDEPILEYDDESSVQAPPPDIDYESPAK
ncbi:hypothetical protein [Hymenobacter canadensis]|uniref:Uncharacterized protein n=1 Tax=Hymenobacter canadensis TaxID=2999067 RepID=A0ABY7LQH7_9BACT|nr:hypothetical protein [Hymenobacter canadensis]WBA42162.1 hypothetical protein O3303_01080 [Hymenobacter canadensis]